MTMGLDPRVNESSTAEAIHMANVPGLPGCLAPRSRQGRWVSGAPAVIQGPVFRALSNRSRTSCPPNH